MADPPGGVPADLLLHVVKAVCQGEDGLHYEAQLGVLLVAGLQGLRACQVHSTILFEIILMIVAICKIFHLTEKISFSRNKLSLIFVLGLN